MMLLSLRASSAHTHAADKSLYLSPDSNVRAKISTVQLKQTQLIASDACVCVASSVFDSDPLVFSMILFVLLHKARDGPGSQLTSSMDIHLFQVLCVIVGH